MERYNRPLGLAWGRYIQGLFNPIVIEFLAAFSLPLQRRVVQSL